MGNAVVVPTNAPGDGKGGGVVASGKGGVDGGEGKGEWAGSEELEVVRAAVTALGRVDLAYVHRAWQACVELQTNVDGGWTRARTRGGPRGGRPNPSPPTTVGEDGAPHSDPTTAAPTRGRMAGYAGIMTRSQFVHVFTVVRPVVPPGAGGTPTIHHGVLSPAVFDLLVAQSTHLRMGEVVTAGVPSTNSHGPSRAPTAVADPPPSLPSETHSDTTGSSHAAGEGGGAAEGDTHASGVDDQDGAVGLVEVEVEGEEEGEVAMTADEAAALMQAPEVPLDLAAEEAAQQVMDATLAAEERRVYVKSGLVSDQSKPVAPIPLPIPMPAHHLHRHAHRSHAAAAIGQAATAPTLRKSPPPASSPSATAQPSVAGAMTSWTWEAVAQQAQSVVLVGEVFALAALLCRGSVEGRAAFLHDLFSGDVTPMATMRGEEDRMDAASSPAAAERVMTQAGTHALVSAVCTVWYRLHQLPSIPAPSIIAACAREVMAAIGRPMAGLVAPAFAVPNHSALHAHTPTAVRLAATAGSGEPLEEEGEGEEEEEEGEHPGNDAVRSAGETGATAAVSGSPRSRASPSLVTSPSTRPVVGIPVIRSPHFCAWAARIAGMDHTHAVIRAFLAVVTRLQHDLGGSTNSGGGGLAGLPHGLSSARRPSMASSLGSVVDGVDGGGDSDAPLPVSLVQVLQTQVAQLCLSVYLHTDLRGVLGFVRAQQVVANMKAAAKRARRSAVQARRDTRVTQRALTPAALLAPAPTPADYAAAPGDPAVIAAGAGVALETLWFRLALTAESPWLATKLGALPAGSQATLNASELAPTLQRSRLMVQLLIMPLPPGVDLPVYDEEGGEKDDAVSRRLALLTHSLPPGTHIASLSPHDLAKALAVVMGATTGGGAHGKVAPTTLPSARSTAAAASSLPVRQRLSLSVPPTSNKMGGGAGATARGRAAAGDGAVGGVKVTSRDAELATLLSGVVLSPRRKQQLAAMTAKAAASKQAGFARPGIFRPHSETEVADAMVVRARRDSGVSSVGGSGGAGGNKRRSSSVTRRPSLIDPITSAIARAEHDFASVAATLQQACHEMEDVERIAAGDDPAAAPIGTFRALLRRKVQRVAAKAAATRQVTAMLATSEAVQSKKRSRALDAELSALLRGDDGRRHSLKGLVTATMATGAPRPLGGGAGGSEATRKLLSPTRKGPTPVPLAPSASAPSLASSPSKPAAARRGRAGHRLPTTGVATTLASARAEMKALDAALAERHAHMHRRRRSVGSDGSGVVVLPGGAGSNPLDPGEGLPGVGSPRSPDWRASPTSPRDAAWMVGASSHRTPAGGGGSPLSPLHRVMVPPLHQAMTPTGAGGAASPPPTTHPALASPTAAHLLPDRRRFNPRHFLAALPGGMPTSTASPVAQPLAAGHGAAASLSPVHRDARSGKRVLSPLSKGKDDGGHRDAMVDGWGGGRATSMMRLLTETAAGASGGKEVDRSNKAIPLSRRPDVADNLAILCAPLQDRGAVVGGVGP